MTSRLVGRLGPLIWALAALGLAVLPAAAQQDERRVALVIGNSAYNEVPLVTPANDAGLVAQTLQAAGFDVVGARDLDGEALRHAFRDFLEKATAAGPGGVAFVYVAGYGLQYEGENYIVPIDARIARDSDVPIEAIRLSDYLRPLASLPLKARFVVVDAARDHPFAKSGQPLASGLALVDAEAGSLIAFNAGPGTIAPEGKGPYGPYAQALAEMIREGGLLPRELFDRVRQRVNVATDGAFLPWSVSRINTPFTFFERTAEAPPPSVSHREIEARRTRTLRELAGDDAYYEALDRDTLDGYLEFLEVYPDHPLAGRVRAIVAARREAITWRRTVMRDTPEAYWSYLDRYPRGPHVGDAHRRLRRLAAAMEPPPSYTVYDYDVPAPPPEEYVIVERRVVYFSDPWFRFGRPPRPPEYYIAPPPPEFVVLAPPVLFVDAYVLPVPVFVPVPRWCDPPRHVVPPPNNVIFNNIHNTVVINNPPPGGPVSGGPVPGGPPPGAAGLVGGPAGPGGAPSPHHTVSGATAAAVVAGAVGAGAAAAALKVALPPAVARRAPPPDGTPPQAGQPNPGGVARTLTTPDGKAVPLPPRSGINTFVRPLPGPSAVMRANRPVDGSPGTQPPVVPPQGPAATLAAPTPGTGPASGPTTGPAASPALRPFLRNWANPQAQDGRPAPGQPSTAAVTQPPPPAPPSPPVLAAPLLTTPTPPSGTPHRPDNRAPAVTSAPTSPPADDRAARQRAIEAEQRRAEAQRAAEAARQRAAQFEAQAEARHRAQQADADRQRQQAQQAQAEAARRAEQRRQAAVQEQRQRAAPPPPQRTAPPPPRPAPPQQQAAKAPPKQCGGQGQPACPKQ